MNRFFRFCHYYAKRAQNTYRVYTGTVMDQRFLDVNRRLNLMDPSIQMVGQPVERRGQWHVVYMQEKSGQT